MNRENNNDNDNHMKIWINKDCTRNMQTDIYRHILPVQERYNVSRGWGADCSMPEGAPPVVRDLNEH